MIVLCCSSQHQLSTARAKCEKNTSEIGQHKLTVHQKEEKVKTLSQELQKQESLVAKLEREIAARKGGATRELELLQHIVMVTDEATGLRDKLEEAKEEKWEAVRKMEVAQVENKLLQGWITELRGQQKAYKVSSARTYLCMCTIVQLHYSLALSFMSLDRTQSCLFLRKEPEICFSIVNSCHTFICFILACYTLLLQL